jgi:V8-like Glu-specific endopeptidase
LPHSHRYRTPTESGNSGSPVFDEDEWMLVGLHHAGSKEMPRLKGKGGTYEANEAFSITAIREAIATNRMS